jgi:predicted CopG family antitoxin
MNKFNELHRTTISLTKENYEKLRRLGSMGESLNVVLSKLLQKEENQ